MERPYTGSKWKVHFSTVAAKGSMYESSPSGRSVRHCRPWTLMRTCFVREDISAVRTSKRVGFPRFWTKDRTWMFMVSRLLGGVNRVLTYVGVRRVYLKVR